jgi:uracil-DNA glycosylase
MEPASDCAMCPRLARFREINRLREPDWHNAPVASFGPIDAKLLIVGLAPGLKGANRTGRPFTGDYAGDLLYATLLTHGFARGAYAARADDGLTLIATRITNAVRCVPPENKPTPLEATTCRAFLTATLGGMRKVRAVLALGRIAHDNVVTALALRRAEHPFRHGAVHELVPELALYDSYHCSRYNTNTGVLTPDMFNAVLARIRKDLDAA